MPTQRVGDIDLYYELHGAGPPLVLMHGLGSSTRDWQLQLEPFCQHYQVLVFDVRGHGQSGKPPGPYSVAEFARDAAGLMQALGIGPAHVLGLSMGGMIAFQLAVSAPELVRSLIIVNSGPALVPRTLAERLAIWQRFAVLRLLGMRKTGEMLSRRMFPAAEFAEVRRVFVERWAENDPRAYEAATRALVGWSVAEHVPSIRVPTLVVASDQDYTPVAAKAAYVAQMPNAELAVIDNARHAAPIERPEPFNRLVLDFLARQA